MVCKPFADGAAQVHSPVHTYAHLVREPFVSGSRTIQHTRVYEALSRSHSGTPFRDVFSIIGSTISQCGTTIG